jgi:hypothetical protein
MGFEEEGEKVVKLANAWTVPGPMLGGATKRMASVWGEGVAACAKEVSHRGGRLHGERRGMIRVGEDRWQMMAQMHFEW